MPTPVLSALLPAALTVLAVALFTVPPAAISSAEYSRAERKAIAAENRAQNAAQTGDQTDTTSNGDDTTDADAPPPVVLTGGEAFTFPTDVPEGDTSFGIDISHHNIQKKSSKIPVKWAQVVPSKVDFVYIKASQGRTLRDSEFTDNWTGAGDAKIPRGAYHFLSALVDAEAQAEFFLSVYADRSADDLAPVVDVEWDYPKDKKTDRWAQKSAAQIVAAVDTWARAVASATGKTPIIYTNRNWWTERVGDAGAELAKTYPLWLANYSAKVKTDTAPTGISGFTTQMWQFTDTGTVPGIDGPVDISRQITPAPADTSG